MGGGGQEAADGMQNQKQEPHKNVGTYLGHVGHFLIFAVKCM